MNSAKTSIHPRLLAAIRQLFNHGNVARDSQQRKPTFTKGSHTS
jgi:hypothetical protein